MHSAHSRMAHRIMPATFSIFALAAVVSVVALDGCSPANPPSSLSIGSVQQRCPAYKDDSSPKYHSAVPCTGTDNSELAMVCGATQTQPPQTHTNTHTNTNTHACTRAHTFHQRLHTIHLKSKCTATRIALVGFFRSQSKNLDCIFLFCRRWRTQRFATAVIGACTQHDLQIWLPGCGLPKETAGR